MAKSVPDEGLGRPIEYDPDFKGPLKNRSCTDVICLLLFVAFVVAWAAIGFWAIKHGDPETLLVPRDSQGRRCGLDPDVADKKYLFFFDLTKCLSITWGCDTPQVCVESCPNDNFYYIANGTNNVALPYCKEAVKLYDPQICPAWYLKSSPFEKRCIPDLSTANQTFLEETGENLHQSDSFVSNILTSISNIKLLAEAEQVAEQVIADIISSWWKILIGTGLALVACIIYILMLRWIAWLMVWTTLVGVVVALGAATYFSCIKWLYWKDLFENNPENGSYKTNKNIFLTLFIIVVIVFAVILLMLIFLRKRIALAIALIKEGSKAVGSVTSVLFFPLVPWILQLGVVAYAICAGVYLATTGDPLYQIRNITSECQSQSQWTNKTECFPSNFTDVVKINASCSDATCRFISMANEAYYPYLQALNIFGFFWLAFFVSALGQMVLAQVFAQWYWTMRKSTLPFFALTAAFYRTFRYHLGTLAFGSLIIAICRMIRVALEYVDRKLKKHDNELVKAIMCCFKCFFWCLEKFLKFINKNAYIMCAIHGKNFCGSAKDAFMLLMRNILRVFVLDKVTDFVFFLSKVLVTLGVGAVAYVFFATDLISFMNNSQLKYGVVPVIIIMIATFLIASLFFSVYSMAVDTLFLCFLEDCERNDGSAEKPYYMSKNLMNIFGKKNKGFKKE